MESKRMFTGTFIDNSIFTAVYNDIISDFSKVGGGKWVELENFHFTYHFLGDVDVDKIPELKETLSQFIKTYNHPLLIEGLDVFPDKRKPRVLHIEIKEPTGNLLKTYSDMDSALIKIGFETEKRTYTPHVTLQRIKYIEKGFSDVLFKYRNYNFGKMAEYKISLIESTLTKQGPIYKVIL